MNLESKKIAVVGGGPGGLTLARLLQLKGANVNVYERDLNRDVRQQGANLDLHEESGLAALKKANLLNAFYANYLPDAGKLIVMDSLGVIHFDEHAGSNQVAEQRPEIDRGPLRKILLDSLQPGTVIWDSQFISMEKAGNGWQLLFKNGKQYYADVVIGSDGANSKIRPYLSNIQPVYSGVTIIEGNIYEAEKNIPNIFKLLKGGKLFAFGNEQTIIVSSKGDGSIAFYTGEKVGENWVKESGINFQNLDEVKHWFKNSFAKWDPLWQELFISSNMSVIPRPLFHFPPTQFWETQSNLTILGDAAHRMPPYAGEGVNMAMLDALELSEALFDDENKTTQVAFTAYEKSMLKRMKKYLAETLTNTIEFHEPQALQYILNMFGSFTAE